MTLPPTFCSIITVNMINMANLSQWPRMGLLSFLTVGFFLVLPFAMTEAKDEAPAVEKNDYPVFIDNEVAHKD